MGRNSKTLLRELRKSKADLASLSQYLYDCESSLEDYQNEWSSVLSKCYNVFSKHEETKEQINELEIKKFENQKFGDFQKENEKEKIADKSPPWAKKLFRKIAMHTHPDKTKEKKLNDFYNKAADCIKGEDYQSLIKICEKLDIEYDIDPELELKISREKQEKIKSRLKEIDHLPAWVWGESFGVKEFRKNFLKSFLMAQNFEELKDEKIFEIIESFEK